MNQDAARGRFAAQSPRLLTSTPRQILGYGRSQLLRAIRMSEGRTVVAVARVRGPAACDGVSNMELCAAFGADIIGLGLYDPHDPYFPGLPNKVSEPESDALLGKVQVDLGRGWSLAEVRQLIGRPIAAAMYGTAACFPDEMEASFVRVVACVENARLLADQGVDIIQVMDWLSEPADIADLVRDIASEVGQETIISFARPNGWGLFGHLGRPEFFTDGELQDLIAAGADIVEIPAVGTFPGLTVNKVGHWAETIHQAGALCNMWIASSQESADQATIRAITLDSKQAGADMMTISDVWLNESVPDPENILALSVALRGRRHTYRRMAFSPLR
jgi:hypothetical protein